MLSTYSGTSNELPLSSPFPSVLLARSACSDLAVPGELVAVAPLGLGDAPRGRITTA